MKKFDSQEIKILRELIRNPRCSDNKISKKTGVPVTTVNRKRKALEKDNMIRYYADLNRRDSETDDSSVSQMYIIKLKIGITGTEFLEKILTDNNMRRFNSEHIATSYLSEKDGHLAIILIMEAHTEQAMTESFNGIVVPMLKRNYGDDCIKSVETTRILETVRNHHNYIPKINMKNGKITENWPDEYIFVDRASFHDTNNKPDKVFQKIENH